MKMLVVADGSVLIDLERGVLLGATFALPYTFAVPDVLYGRELEAFNGQELVAMGLQVLRLSGQGVEMAQAYRAREPRLSLVDALALALAKLGGDILVTPAADTEIVPENRMLLSGDGALRKLAAAENVECRGLFWVLDRIEENGLLSPTELYAALSGITSHPRCRLPKSELLERMKRYLREGPIEDEPE